MIRFSVGIGEISMILDWFKNCRPKGKIIGHKILSCGMSVIEYTGDYDNGKINGMDIDFTIEDEWQAYTFAEEVMVEVAKIQERRNRNTELLMSTKLTPKQTEDNK